MNYCRPAHGVFKTNVNEQPTFKKKLNLSNIISIGKDIQVSTRAAKAKTKKSKPSQVAVVKTKTVNAFFGWNQQGIKERTQPMEARPAHIETNKKHAEVKPSQCKNRENTHSGLSHIAQAVGILSIFICNHTSIKLSQKDSAFEELSSRVGPISDCWQGADMAMIW